MTAINNTVNDFLSGKILLINKPIRWTSFDVVKKIRTAIKKKFNLKKIKVGHAGTLDPLATGLLIVCTGKYTKKIHEFQKQKKTYTGEIVIGGETPSYDLETSITKKYKTSHITYDDLNDVKNKFIGPILQKPPIFSAIKQDGVRLYNKARKGEFVITKERSVTVHSFDIIKYENPLIHFKITCGTGTYIRSIAHDFGKELSNGAHLSKLCRTHIGEYSLSDAMNINDFRIK